MIVKFFKRGTGSCLATMDYLLGKNQDREHAKVLQGDPKLTQQLADSLEFKHKYTVGVLSFQEKDLDEKTKREIMADFEQSLLCGLEADQYNICWIEHKDKDRLELNFVIPKVELSTGKALNPYFDSVDRKRVNAFKDHTNAKYDLYDPNDPQHRQALTPKYNLPKDKKALQEAITGYLMGEIGLGTIKDREGVLRALQSDLGLSVARITPNSISISDPNNENGRNIRLKGEIYADTFRFSQDHSEQNERASAEYRANRARRIDKTGALLTAEIERKRTFNHNLYQRPPNKPTNKIESSFGIQELADDNHWRTVGDNPSHGVGESMGIQEPKRHESREKPNTDNPRPNAFNAQSAKSAQHTAGREILLHCHQKQGSASFYQSKRRTDHQNQKVRQNHAQSIFERLQRLVERTRTAVKQLTGNHRHAEQTDRAITDSQSRLESTERTINRHDNHESNQRAAIGAILGETQQREQATGERERQTSQLVAEQQKALDKGKGFGFGR